MADKKPDVDIETLAKLYQQAVKDSDPKRVEIVAGAASALARAHAATEEARLLAVFAQLL